MVREEPETNSITFVRRKINCGLGQFHRRSWLVIICLRGIASFPVNEGIWRMSSDKTSSWLTPRWQGPFSEPLSSFDLSIVSSSGAESVEETRSIGVFSAGGDALWNPLGDWEALRRVLGIHSLFRAAHRTQRVGEEIKKTHYRLRTSNRRCTN